MPLNKKINFDSYIEEEENSMKKRGGFFKKFASGLGITKEQKKRRLMNTLELEEIKTKIAKQRKAQGPRQGFLARQGIRLQPNANALFGSSILQQPKPTDTNKPKKRRPKKIVYYG